ncbi:hypothetical protein [Faecalispora anaeroviscerum]|uniref:hypothetical protein n=1 Tax=Faecalispora anaeroviscerum TaxID=2991836 RepID=UPI0024BB3B26|nr:hypothetical protein [Faecalispora anaeroviscerum]
MNAGRGDILPPLFYALSKAIKRRAENKKNRPAAGTSIQAAGIFVFAFENSLLQFVKL